MNLIPNAAPQRRSILGAILLIAHKPTHNSSEMASETTEPAFSDARGVECLQASDGMYSIGERYSTSRSSHGIPLFQQSKTAPFTDAEVRMRLLPGSEGLLGDAVLPAQIADRNVLSGLTECIGNLFFGEH